MQVNQTVTHLFTDYYKRVYLSHQSSSAISYAQIALVLSTTYRRYQTYSRFDSWIGSINSLLVVSAGIVVGRLYDRGYLYETEYYL